MDQNGKVEGVETHTYCNAFEAVAYDARNREVVTVEGDERLHDKWWLADMGSAEEAQARYQGERDVLKKLLEKLTCEGQITPEQAAGFEKKWDAENPAP